MLQLGRKQMKAFLDVMSKDKYRTGLTQAYIKEYKGERYLFTTDGYCLAGLKLSTAFPQVCTDKVVSRKELVKWYKLAEGKEVFTEAELIDILAEEKHTPPDISQVLGRYVDGELEPIDRIALNPKFWQTMNDLAGIPLVMRHHGKQVFVGENPGRGDIYVVMGMKV